MPLLFTTNTIFEKIHRIPVAMINTLLFRTMAIILHTVLNIIIINYLLAVDVTGSWVRFGIFVAIILALFLLFVKHFFSFIRFLKSTP